MDDLGWDVDEDSFLISNTNSSVYGDEMNLQDGIFIDPIRKVQESQPCDHVLKWGDGRLAQQWCSSFSALLNASAASDIGKAVHGSLINGGGATISLESIDCLLSATNSSTHNNDSSGIKHINHENEPKSKKSRSEKTVPGSSNINFQQPSSSSLSSSIDEPDPEAISQMKEMIYRAAAFKPVNLGVEEAVERPKRKNVKISTDPQTVAARQRRERISERIRVLQKLVPGGNKMDTASMLDEAASYLKFLRSQVKTLENLGHPMSTAFTSLPLNQSLHMQTHNFLFLNLNHIHLL